MLYADGLQVAKKVKYAKFHAARILKALKEGGDINLPPATPEVEEPTTSPSQPPPPTLEEVPDDFYAVERRMAGTSEADRSLHPSRPSSPGRRAPSPPPPPNAPIDLRTPSPTQEVSPLLQSSSPPKDASYFPEVPSIHEPGQSNLLPPTISPANVGLPEMHTFSESHYPTPPKTYQRPPPQPQNPYFQQHSASPAGSAFHQTPLPQANTHVPPPQRHPIRKQVTPEDIAKAQKFAKWAISALDYDDVENAIEQFRKGLEMLGAS